MAVSQNSWITCLEPEDRGLFPGTKVHFTECIQCEITGCPIKGFLFSHYFPKWVSLEESGLNGKMIELNKTLARRKKGVSQLYCPKRKNATTHCSARSAFCRYNVICGRYTKRNTKEFIKSMRWRKVMIYVVMYLDGTSEVVDRNSFSNVDIDKVERVYPGNYEVTVVSELVPLGEEQQKLTETVATFMDKYNGAVVTTDGMVEFEEWFKNSATGDSAVIPEKVLVPQKTYKISKIKGEVQISGAKGAAKVDIPIEVKKPEKKPEKKVEVPAEKVAEKPVVKPAAKPVAKPVKKSVAKPVVKPAKKLVAKPAKNPAAKPKPVKKKPKKNIQEALFKDEPEKPGKKKAAKKKSASAKGK